MSSRPPMATVEHEFASGWTATLREHLPLHVVVRRATAAGDLDLLDALEKLDAGTLDDPGQAMILQDAIVRAMFVSPRILPTEAEPVEVTDGTMLIDDLSDGDLNEVVELAMKGVADAARFRGGTDGARGGKGGANVGASAKRATRAPARKRGGART